MIVKLSIDFASSDAAGLRILLQNWLNSPKLTLESSSEDTGVAKEARTNGSRRTGKSLFRGTSRFGHHHTTGEISTKDVFLKVLGIF